MAANKDFSAQLGRAWALHRQGNNDAAVNEFKGILNEASDNIDALYGLGLSQRAAGKAAEATASFSKSLEITQRELKAKPGEDRFEMLERMIKQRLAELHDHSTV